MKRIALAVAVLLGSFAAYAQGQGPIVAQELVSAATHATPTAADFTVTTGSTIGKSIAVENLSGVFIYICGIGGNPTGGTMRAWGLDSRTGQVFRVPDADLTITSQSTPCVGWLTWEVTMRGAGIRLMWVSASYTASAGTTLNVYYRAWATRTP